MSQQTITQAIYDKLISDQSTGSLYALLAGRIHHLRGPEQVALPWLSFTLSQDRHQAYFGQADDVEGQLTIDLWSKAADGVAAAHLLSDKLHTLLHRQSLEIAGYAQSQLVNLDRGVAQIDGQAIRIRSLWRLWASVG